ncbi:Cyclin-U4-1 [Nymphaea thermarum]|nr:Cyclin-U4-1 [Nymphaea thermarum]
MGEIHHPQFIPKVVTFLSSLLERVAESNDIAEAAFLSGSPPLSSSPPSPSSALPPFSSPQRTSVFHGLTRPTISIRSYLERIFRYANCSPSCFVVAYIYLDRFASKQPATPITSYNVHRLLITSVMVAAKFLDDLYYNNAYYAKVGGVSTTEMNCLEIDFLFSLGFQLNVTPPTFHAYCMYLQRGMLEFEYCNIQRTLRIHGCYASSPSGSSDEANSQNQQFAVYCTDNSV